MSVIGKKPFVNKIVDTCSKEQTQQIIDLMNHLGNPTLVALYGCDNLIGPANIGVSYVTLKMNQLLAQIVNGILVYIDDTHCGFFGITSNSDNIDEFEIDPVNKTYNKIRENLTVEELRQVCGDRLVEVGGNITVQADDIDSGSATEGQTLVADGQGGAVWGDAGGGLPEATKAGQVLVSNENLEFEERDAVPMAENLTPVPETNDTMYSAGPTGGLTDITTGEESYLKEVKGYSIVWNQLIDASHSYTRISSHIYIRHSSGNNWSLIQNSSTNESASSTNKLFDLTLMFGGNDKIPFSLTNSTEYQQNGSIPEQQYQAIYGFARLFANVDLVKAPYNAGTIKNVSATKLVESGQNLWDASTMEETGLQLLAGYRYEVYYDKDLPQAYSPNFSVSIDNGQTWTTNSLSWRKVQRTDGKYICYIYPTKNCLIKSMSYSNGSKIAYVGFVHSGNYCLTSGTNTEISGTSIMLTNMQIPAYKKHEFNISGISGLNGIPDSSENHCSIYDTKDTTRVRSVDLSTLEWTAGTNTFSATISDIKPSTTQLLATKYIGSEMSVSGTTITITTSASPTGTLLYELATPEETGESAFEPIRIEVNDMGMEYFKGLDVCPVNQLSQYYKNLKDKLVNITEPIEVSAINYSSARTNALFGIRIGNNYYNLPPVVTENRKKFTALNTSYIGGSMATYYDSIFLGEGSGPTYNTSYSSPSCMVSVGGNARSTYNAVAIGYESNAGGSRSVAIGYYSLTGTAETVSFDGWHKVNNVYTDYHRTLLLFDATKIFFRNERIKGDSWNPVALTSYTSGHKLSEYIQNNVMVSDGTKYYIEYIDADNYKTFTGNKASGTFTAIDKLINGVHITLKLSTDVVVGIDLLPYDTTNSKHFTGYGIASDTPTFVSAYIDSDGTVVINPPSGVTVVEATYNIR